MARWSFVGLTFLRAEHIASLCSFATGEALHQSVDELHSDLAGVLALLLGSLRDRDLGFRGDKSLEQSQLLTFLLAVNKVLEGPLRDELHLVLLVLLCSRSTLVALLGLDAEGDLVV